MFRRKGILASLLLGTMLFSAACGSSGGALDIGKDGQSGISSSVDGIGEGEKGPFFLLSQKTVSLLDKDMIPADWSPEYPGGIGTSTVLNVYEDFGDFKIKMYDRGVYGDTLCEVYSVYGEEMGPGSYYNVGMICCIYSAKEGTRYVSLKNADMINDENQILSFSEFAGFKDGNLYMILRGVKIADEEDSDEDNAEESNGEYYLASVDLEGQLLIISKIPADYGQYDHFMDKDRLYALDYSGRNMCRYSEDYTSAKDFTCDKRIQGYSISSDGNAYVYGVSSGELWIKDDPNDEPIAVFGKPYEFQDYKDYAVSVSEGVAIVCDETGAYRLENEELSFCSFADQDFILDGYNGAYQTEDGGFEIYGLIDNDFSLFTAKPCDQNPKYLKENIYIEIFASEYFKKALARYNRQSDKYRISLWNQGEFESFEAKMDDFALKMATGNGPDIVVSDYLNMNTMAKSGGILCLDELMPADDSEYVLSIFECCKVGDSLYSIPIVGSVLNTLVTSKEIAAGRSSWTLSEFMETIERSGCEKAIDLSAMEIVDYFGLWAMENKNLIDWENRKSNLEGEEFIKLLEFAKRYGLDEGKNTRDEDVQQDVYDRKIACKSLYQFEYENFLACEAYYKGEASYIGYPSETGESGTYVIAPLSLCINADTKNPEAAKDFLRWLISKEGQQVIFDYQADRIHGGDFDVSLRWDITEKQIEYINEYNSPGVHRIVKPDGSVEAWENGMRVSGAVSYMLRPLTEDEIERYKSILKNARPVKYGVLDIRSIFEEEIGAFISGQKSAEETARIIDSRVQIYLDENM